MTAFQFVINLSLLGLAICLSLNNEQKGTRGNLEIISCVLTKFLLNFFSGKGSRI